MIPVAKPYFPPIETYHRYLERIYQAQWLTNAGPLNLELTERLKCYLGVEHLLLVANGTIALQVAQQALGVCGNVVTTPFTFAATAGAIAWQGTELRFADIDADSCNLSVDSVRPLIDNDTGAIMPVHVYGNPCDVEAFEALSERIKIPVIYDAAHAFGVRIGSQSVLQYGDASTLSFHATKLFHCGEGGAIVFRNNGALERAKKIINFGIDTRTAQPVGMGINGKMSELHAAMGLAVLDNIEEIISHRRGLEDQYLESLSTVASFPVRHADASRNGAYMPVVTESESQRAALIAQLREQGYEARAYFSPSLDAVDGYGGHADVPNSHCASRALVCLPLHTGLNSGDVETVCGVVKRVIG